MEYLALRKMEIIFKEEGFKHIAEKICFYSVGSGFKNLCLTNKTISNFCKNFAAKKWLKNKAFVALMKIAKEYALEDKLKNIFIQGLCGDDLEKFQDIFSESGKKIWAGKLDQLRIFYLDLHI